MTSGGNIFEGSTKNSELKYNKETLLNTQGFLCLERKLNL